MESEHTKEAEKELEICKAVIQLEEKHEECMHELRAAEERFVETYKSAVSELDECMKYADKQVDEEVVWILMVVGFEA